MQVDVLIVGGGVSGLATAFYAKRRGLSVYLCESAPIFGGKVQTLHEQNFLWEAGPHTLQSKDADLMDLVETLGLSSQLIFASPKAKKRYLVRSGRLVSLPYSPLSALTSATLSPWAKLCIFKDLWCARSRQTDESVYDFFKRRFGGEVADYPLNAFVRGIYAGDPKKLLVQSAFPKLKELEQEHRSIILGIFRRSRSRSKARARRASPIFSFRSGMRQLIDALTNDVATSCHRETSLMSLVRSSPHGYRAIVKMGSCQQEVFAHQVVLACPADELARIIDPLSQQAAAYARSLEYPPLSVVVTGFQRVDIPHPLDGFGCLCPAIEKRFMLGSLWSSSLFPGRAPDGGVLLTAMVGGSSEPEKGNLSDEQLLEGVLHDYRELLGVRSRPYFVRIMRWRESIPQYTREHALLEKHLLELESHFPGLFVSGNLRGGVSVGSCVSRAKEVSRRLTPPHLYLRPIKMPAF